MQQTRTLREWSLRFTTVARLSRWGVVSPATATLSHALHAVSVVNETASVGWLTLSVRLATLELGSAGVDGCPKGFDQQKVAGMTQVQVIPAVRRNRRAADVVLSGYFRGKPFVKLLTWSSAESLGKERRHDGTFMRRRGT